MKFLCVPCDRPMTLVQARPPENGSLAVVYACPDCGYEMALLTNPHETQVVASLGARIGPASEGNDNGGGCPFAGIARGEAPVEGVAEGALPWTGGALARLGNVPAFVREMARAGIERFARESGRTSVDEDVLEQARSHFGM